MELRIEYAKTTDGVSIAYTVLGKGPAIVLCSTVFGDLNNYAHGASSWLDQLAAAGRKVVFYDARGAGSSDRDVPDSLGARVSDLEGVVDRIGLESFALVGRIHGAATAVAYAVRHPDNVTQLVVWDGYARGSDYYSATAYTRALKALTGGADEDWDFLTLTVAHWAVGFRDAERANALAAAFKTGRSWQSYVNVVEATEAVDVSAMLPNVSVPTLVIRDRSAVLSDPGGAKTFAATIPSAQFVTVASVDDAVRAVIEFTATKTEAPPAVDVRTPGGLRTVLFTDLVGHTEMMQRLGDAKGREVLREHERITRDLLKQHGGAEVKTMGDGFLASFGSVTKAMDCAIALQQAFAAWNEGADGAKAASLQVRVGLNAGEPIEEDGDLFGSTVILASRIAAKAGAGEILIREPLRHLLSGKSYVYADRGETMLKGFEDAVRLYEVRWRE